MKYWLQQLNFAVFCATQACGVLRDIFDKGVSLPPQIRASYQFHVYFTVRRILFHWWNLEQKRAARRPDFQPRHGGDGQVELDFHLIDSELVPLHALGLVGLSDSVFHQHQELALGLFRSTASA